MGNWYDYDVKSRKALITLMESSQQPMIVTAGKIIDLSLTTFVAVIFPPRVVIILYPHGFQILKKSYSLIAVLKNYQ
jgi:hypothetical protein